jgi:hypothetical protein
MAIVGTLLDDGSGSGTGNQTTASISPTANALILVAVGCYNSDDVTGITSVTGNGITYELVAAAAAVDDGFGDYVLRVYRGMSASPSAGVITIDPAASFGSTQVDWCVAEFTGVDTSGTNGSGAVVQSPTNTLNNGTSLTVTLAAFAAAENGAFGAVISYNNRTVTHEAGWTELDTDGSQLHAQWRADNDTTCTFTLSSTDDAGAVAVEIAAAADEGTTLTAGNIPTRETFGTARLIRVLAAQGITSRETVAAANLLRVVVAGAIPTRADVGGPAAVRVLTAGNIPSREAVSAPNLIRVLAALGIASEEELGSPTVSFFSDIEQAGQIESEEAFGVAAIIRVLAGAAIPSGETFGSTNVIRPIGAVGGIGSGEVVGAPDLLRALGAGGIVSGEQVSAPNVLRVIFAVSVSTGETFGVATVAEFVPPDPGAGPVLGKVLVSDRAQFHVVVADGETWVVSVRDLPLGGVDVGDLLGG